MFTICGMKGTPGFMCEKCKGADAVTLYPGMVKYLRNTETLSFNQSLYYKISKKSYLQLKEIVTGVVEICIETPLHSIEKQFKEYV